MLNLGKSKLVDEYEWNKIDHGYVSEVEGKLELDDTIKAIAKILNETHPRLEGNLTIKNIFNLRQPKSEDAIDIYLTKMFYLMIL